MLCQRYCVQQELFEIFFHWLLCVTGHKLLRLKYIKVLTLHTQQETFMLSLKVTSLSMEWIYLIRWHK